MNLSDVQKEYIQADKTAFRRKKSHTVIKEGSEVHVM